MERTTISNIGITEAVGQNQSLKIGLGILGGVLGVATIIGITAIVIYLSTNAGTGVAEIKLNLNNKDYMSRGIRGKLGYQY